MKLYNKIYNLGNVSVKSFRDLLTEINVDRKKTFVEIEKDSKRNIREK